MLRMLLPVQEPFHGVGMDIIPAILLLMLSSALRTLATRRVRVRWSKTLLTSLRLPDTAVVAGGTPLNPMGIEGFSTRRNGRNGWGRWGRNRRTIDDRRAINCEDAAEY